MDDGEIDPVAVAQRELAEETGYQGGTFAHILTLAVQPARATNRAHLVVATGIVPLFRAALENEHHYPPKYGTLLLELDDFKDNFDADFILRYRRVEVEYTAHIADRIYRTHSIRSEEALTRGTLAQQTLALSSSEVKLAKSMGLEVTTCGACLSVEHHSLQGRINKLVCWRCLGIVCSRCHLLLHDSSGKHECVVHSNPVVDLEAVGRRRGVYFQICPK